MSCPNDIPTLPTGTDFPQVDIPTLLMCYSYTYSCSQVIFLHFDMVNLSGTQVIFQHFVMSCPGGIPTLPTGTDFPQVGIPTLLR